MRIKTALKQSPLCEGSPKGQRAWGVFLWLLFFAQAKTKSPGAILNSRMRTRRANAREGVRKVTRPQAKKRFSKPEKKSD